MKKVLSDKNADPVPSRVGIIVAVILLTLVSVVISAGKAASDKGWEIPVLLSDGSVIQKPWYITIEGEKVALLESEEAAEETLQNIIDGYRKDDESILDIEIKENTSAEKMDIGIGDKPPDIMTSAEAERMLTQGNGGEGYLTVVTTEEQRREESVDFEREYKTSANINAGESRIAEEGKTGIKEVVKKVVKENGQQVDEEIVEEEMLKQPQEQVVITGVKLPEGIGGGMASADSTQLSYDETAIYDKLMNPSDEGRISSGFGPRWGKFHRGLDIALPQGRNVYAADSGTVYFSGWSGGYGNMIRVDHGNGMQTYYAHCSKLLAGNGQQVQQGDVIAQVGSTGNSTGPHIHFEVIINRNCVNPIDFLDF